MNGQGALHGGPFRIAFVAAIAVVLALMLAAAVISVGSVITLIFAAFFIALGLFPIIRWLEARGLSTAIAVLVVSVVFVLFVAALVLLIIPLIGEEAIPLVRSLPGHFDQIEAQSWFVTLDDDLGGILTIFLQWVQTAAADPNLWLTVGGGALHIGLGIINGVFGGLIVIVLTLYFVAALPSIKQGLYALVPASRKPGVENISEQIADSVGKYLSGMVLLALINSVFTFLLLTILGVHYALVLAVLAFPLTLIPLVGSVISTTIVVIVSLFTSPTAGLIALIVMLAYMQVESLVLTPRIAGRAVKVPAYLVLMGALIGGALLGLLGVFVACPTIAAILLIARAVVIPRQAAR